jgi:hypothetical protein
MFSPTQHGKRAKNRKSQKNGKAQDRAHRTQVHTRLARVQVRQEVNLRSQKKQQEH